MAVQIALLRAVNVGGRIVPMAELRDLASGLGMARVRSVLQSGNLVFESPSLAGADLEAELEAQIRRRFELATHVLARTAWEWDTIIADNPFADQARADPGHLLLMPLKGAPAEARVADLKAAIVGRELVHAEGRTLYLVYPDGVGRSRLTIALIERKLGVRGTARNWNTVRKLAAAANA